MVNESVNEYNVDGVENVFADAGYDELDREITCNDIENAIRKLKLNKSCNEDYIMMNEIFIRCKEILLPLLHTLFNKIFDTSLYPETWSRSCIVPLFKKGDVNFTNNYRGISIVSCFGKLYTSILNSRLLDWEKDHNILSDAQYGFISGLSTADAIFVLQSFINRTWEKF
jgi:hypothetical protein